MPDPKMTQQHWAELAGAMFVKALGADVTVYDGWPFRVIEQLEAMSKDIADPEEVYMTMEMGKLLRMIEARKVDATLVFATAHAEAYAKDKDFRWETDYRDLLKEVADAYFFDELNG